MKEGRDDDRSTQCKHQAVGCREGQRERREEDTERYRKKAAVDPERDRERGEGGGRGEEEISGRGKNPGETTGRQIRGG